MAAGVRALHRRVIGERDVTAIAWLLVGGWWLLLIAVTRWPWLIAVGVLLAVRHRLDAGDLGGRSFEVAWFEAARTAGMPDRVTAWLRPRSGRLDSAGGGDSAGASPVGCGDEHEPHPDGERVRAPGQRIRHAPQRRRGDE